MRARIRVDAVTRLDAGVLLDAVALLGAGSLVGWLAWRPPAQFLALWALPLLWRLRWRPLPNRCLLLGYYATALFPVTMTVHEFWPRASLGGPALAWVACTLLLWAPWAWAAHRPQSPWRFAAALTATALPPLGAIGLASPLFAACPAFPDLGLVGLALSAVGLTVLATVPRCTAWFTVLLLSLVATAAHALLAPAGHRPAPEQTAFQSETCGLQGLPPARGSLRDRRLPPRRGMAPRRRLAPRRGCWIAVTTHLGRIPLPLPAWAERNLALRRMALDTIRHHPAGSVILFPEMIVGPWTRWSASAWRPVTQAARKHHDTVLLGAVLSNGKGGELDVLLGLGAHPSVTAARQPIPLSEWHPWALGSFPAPWWTFGPSRVAGRRTAVLVCYEQLLIWPVAWSFLSSTPPTLMIGVSNHGWSGPGAIEPRLQAAAAAALAHLFGVPLVVASNAPAHTL